MQLEGIEWYSNRAYQETANQQKDSDRQHMANWCEEIDDKTGQMHL